MSFRTSAGLVSDHGDPSFEADVIMTAATLGMAGMQCLKQQSLRFDIDPKDQKSSWTAFEAVVDRIDDAVHAHLSAFYLNMRNTVRAGLAVDHQTGAAIMGIYEIGGQSPPADFRQPEISAQGQELYQQIANGTVRQYVGRGAYSGFVDPGHPQGQPVGPRPTTRFLTPVTNEATGISMTSHPRWIPSLQSHVWKPRQRSNKPGSYIPWGLIGGDRGAYATFKENDEPSNEGDDLTTLMAEQGMEFVGEPDNDDVVGYTHGMIQAIYEAYHLGPSYVPYEIAVGTATTKMASCIPCAIFMNAQGYIPSSIHLGRGESWAPLWEPHSPSSSHQAVVRDLNKSWRRACHDYLKLGMAILRTRVSSTHKDTMRTVEEYFTKNSNTDSDRTDRSVASTLILDALTIHDSELNRILRTLA